MRCGMPPKPRNNRTLSSSSSHRRKSSLKWLITGNFLFWLTILSPQSVYGTISRQLHYKQLLQIDPVIVYNNPAAVAWLGWSPNGKRLGVVYEDEHKIRILDAASGKVEFTIDVPEATFQGALDLAWSPDGNYLAGTFDIS